jgi:hypothetical protein
MSFSDTYYIDTNDVLHFLSAQDLLNAYTNKLPLPDSSWTIATTDQINNVVNPTITIAQQQQLTTSQLQSEFQIAITTPILFTTSTGITNTFPSDSVTLQHHIEIISSLGGIVPSDFYLVAVDNTKVVFTSEDFTNFRIALGTRGWNAKKKLDLLLDQVNSVTNTTTNPIQTIKAIVW